MYRTDKLSRLATRAMENALDLHADSIHLFRRRSYGSTLALSVLAAEEIGKYCIIEDVVWNSDINGLWTNEEKENWLRAAFDHRVKQSKFGGMAERILPPTLLARIWKGELERDKQRGVYVGLPRRGRGIDLGGRLSSPRHVGRGRAERQITIVNDCLVSMCIGCSADVYLLDIDDVHKELNLSLARRLNRNWPRMGREAQKFVKEVNPAWWKARVRNQHRRRGAGSQGRA